MQDDRKTKQQLIEELCGLRKSLGEAKASAEIFSTVFNAAPALVAITRLRDGVIVGVNRAWEEATGWTREEIIGHTTKELKVFVNNSDREHIFHEIDEKGYVRDFQCQLRHKSGRNILILMSMNLLKMAGEMHLLGIAQDISARRLLEEALQNSETRFRTLYDATADAVMLMGEQNFFDCNKATLDIFGCATREEFCCKHPADLSPPRQRCGTDSLSLANRMLATAMKKGSVRFEWVHRRSDTGKSFPADVLLTAMELDGKPMIQAVVRDITERREAEEKVLSTMNFLQTLIDTIPSPIFCKDVRGRYVECNREFEAYTGLRKEEIIGKDVYEMYPQDVADKYYGMDAALFRQPGRQAYEHPIIYADGSRRDVVVNKATYRNADGSLAGIVGVMVDITDRKRNEEELAKYRDGLEELVRKRTGELESQKKILEELNIAMKVLLDHHKADKEELEDRFVMNVKDLILPFTEKLKNTGLDERQRAYLEVMETQLNYITSSLIKKLHQFKFTPTELEVASLIREGKATREIARIIGTAPSSINTHRNNIRKKLGISKKNVNLRSLLRSFD